MKVNIQALLRMIFTRFIPASALNYCPDYKLPPTNPAVAAERRNVYVRQLVEDVARYRHLVPLGPTIAANRQIFNANS
jgi:hypothetical protein